MKRLLKQKHLFTFSVLMIAFSLLGLTSCADEPYYGEPPIIGGWQLVGPPSVGYNEFVFYPDGSGTYYVDDAYGTDTYYIEWETFGNELTVYFSTDTMYFNWAIRNGYLYLYPIDGVPAWMYSPF